MGAWTEIVDFTFTANETSRTFSGLSITKDDFIKVVVTNVNGSGTSGNIRLFPNTAAGVSGFDTNTNYHVQVIESYGSSVDASRINENRFTRTAGSQTGYVVAYFKISENGKINIFGNRFTRLDSSLENNFDYTTSSNLTFSDPITSLTFLHAVTNGLGTGSRIQIYRLDAEKVADITTTTTGNEIEISGLNIGKDNEYLLVTDLFITTGQGINLFINDDKSDTTTSNYYSQNITGSGTSASALRANRTNYIDGSNARTLSYIFIKLSEIGAYTYQAYSMGAIGTSSINLNNNFGSSISESITSINKLHVRASAGSNFIGSDSRAILYKLK